MTSMSRRTRALPGARVSRGKSAAGEFEPKAMKSKPIFFTSPSKIGKPPTRKPGTHASLPPGAMNTPASCVGVPSKLSCSVVN